MSSEGNTILHHKTLQNEQEKSEELIATIIQLMIIAVARLRHATETIRRYYCHDSTST